MLFGKDWGSLKTSISGFVGDGQRTDQDDYFSSTGEKLNHSGNWELNPLFLNFGLSINNFKARFIWDRYSMTQAADYGSTNLDEAQKQLFDSRNLDLQYDYRPVENFTFTPFATYQWHKPWWVESGPFISNKQYERMKAGFRINWSLLDHWAAVAGFEAMRDAAKTETNQQTFVNGRNDVSYLNFATYGQLEYSGFVTATAGARAEHHSNSGFFVVPRGAITKTWDKWHFKVLYALAFRSPGISNIDLGVVPNDIEPERTRTGEIEVGRQIGAGLLSLNVFDTTISKPLVYLGEVNQYENQASTGSYGVEMEYKYRPSWGFLNTSMSFYSDKDKTDFYSAPGDSGYSLAAPRFKAALAGGWKFAQDWVLGPSLIYLHKRQGYAWIEDEAVARYHFFDPAWLLNLNLLYSFQNFTASFSVHDILDSNPGFLQHYRGGQPHIPGPSREFFIKLRYGF